MIGRPASSLSVAKITERASSGVDAVEARHAGGEPVTDERGAETVERPCEEVVDLGVARERTQGDVQLVADEVVVIGEGEDGGRGGVEDDQSDPLPSNWVTSVMKVRTSSAS